MSAEAAALQELLVDLSRERLDARRRDALWHALFWGVVLLAGAGAVAAGAQAVMNRVIRPLDRLRGAMLALAQGDLSVPLAEAARRAVEPADDMTLLLLEGVEGAE